MSDITKIQITKETRGQLPLPASLRLSRKGYPAYEDELEKIGSMGDDYNKVIKKLIEEHYEHIHKQKIDKLAKEADDFIKEHRDEFVGIDEL